MGLRKRQSEFAFALSKLLTYMYSNGYEATIQDVTAANFHFLISFLKTIIHYLPVNYQDKLLKFIRYLKRKSHSKKSSHYIKLAADINLFKNGKYLNKTKDHVEFGIYWESLGGFWGGRIGESESGSGDGKDGNHYSFSYNGRK